MPLIADPSSTCIICNLPYSYADHDDAAKRQRAPHALTCGHIFCLGCLERTLRERPSCPLCRMPCDVSRIVRLFLDSAAQSVEDAPATRDARRRLATAIDALTACDIRGADRVGEIADFLDTVPPRRDEDQTYATAVHAVADVLDRLVEAHAATARAQHVLEQRAHAAAHASARADALVDTLMDEIAALERRAVPAPRPRVGTSSAPTRVPAAHAPAVGSVPGVVYIPGPPPGKGVVPVSARRAAERDDLDARLRAHRLEQYRARAEDQLEAVRAQGAAPPSNSAGGLLFVDGGGEGVRNGAVDDPFGDAEGRRRSGLGLDLVSTTDGMSSLAGASGASLLSSSPFLGPSHVQPPSRM
ncbi:hypothetical protein K488DRAFT_88015 [Vararia minispora EC-137]|uniref:Uncharacterized protein n=1 Tax=Vararia minispora EC-137 TaxID=1314806 RepID=A0ACB8QEQ5_9AGAM|nr:hypothetical protein K488DRAFT_88015 [Vararia minispora EC-137]